MPDMHIGNQHFGYFYGAYMWDILLNDISYDDLRKHKVFIYSTRTLGRNPYVMADLSDVIDMSEHLGDDEFLSASYDGV